MEKGNKEKERSVTAYVRNKRRGKTSEGGKERKVLSSGVCMCT